jgi:heptosyltransferase-2
MKILVRLPNWLGDIIMSTSFLNALKKAYPESEIDVIIKKELSDLLNYCNDIDFIYKFSKKEHPGVKGLYAFGKSINKRKKYDLFFSLPDSFSSVLLGYFTGSKIRIGYKNEFRNLLLTNSYTKGKGLHRTDEYLELLTKFSGKKITAPAVSLHKELTSVVLPEGANLIFNINSEAQSRRMPVELAIELINGIKKKLKVNILLTGSGKDIPYVEELLINLTDKNSIFSYAGKTSLAQLIQLVSQADYTISTDSGVAHLSNAFSVKTIVLFGAGNELNTSPYNKTFLKIIRKEGLDCAPCLSNTCKFGAPKCLTMMESAVILSALEELQLEKTKS